MSGDIAAAVRRCRAAISATVLQRRPDADLPFLRDEAQIAGRRVVLDACVYVDQLQGQLPALVESLIEVRAVHHSSLAMGEAAFLIGRLDPGDLRTEAAVTAIQELLSAVRPDRIASLDPPTIIEGSIRAGVIARLLGYDDPARRKALLDAMIASQAARNGLTVLTRNVADFDRLSQLDPRLAVVFYERTGTIAKPTFANESTRS